MSFNHVLGRPPIPAKKAPQVRDEDLQGFYYLKTLHKFLKNLKKVCPDPKRKLTYDHYLSLYLLAFFTPVITSMRALQRASDLPRLQRKLGLKGRPSLGSLSEAGNVFPPEELSMIIGHLCRKVSVVQGDKRLRELTQKITAVDGTLLQALPKMVWALWLDEEHRAAKVHLQFEVLKSAPVHAVVTDANTAESAPLRQSLQSGRLYVMDAGYMNYALFKEILQAQSSFVCRLNPRYVLRDAQDRPLSEADIEAGVISDQVGRLGSGDPRRSAPEQPIRVIQVRLHNGQKTTVLHIATDHLDFPAELIALIYRHRWSIELFFRWLKCILGVRHLFSLSLNGLQIQVYAALIASLLMVLWTGQKPTKVTLELMSFYMNGWLSTKELMQRLGIFKKQQ